MMGLLFTTICSFCVPELAQGTIFHRFWGVFAEKCPKMHPRPPPYLGGPDSMVILSSVDSAVLSVQALPELKLFQKKSFFKNNSFYPPYLGYARQTGYVSSSQFCNPRPTLRPFSCSPHRFCTISRELITECLFKNFIVKQTQVFVLGRK